MMADIMTRKEFLKRAGLGVATLFCAGAGYGFFEKSGGNKSIQGQVFKNDAPKEPWKWSIEGFYYATDGKTVQCQVCPNRCVLDPGDRSICRSKVNIAGKLYSLAYGDPCSVHVDPIEKKPLNHFHPRSLIFSIAAAGCNFRCLNCQNWEISQRKPEEIEHMELFPDQVVKEAKNRGVPSIAYTYSEPTSFYEYMVDTAKLAREAGLRNVLVSNGYINREPLLRLAQYLDGANINLKSFSNDIYRTLNGGTLQPVLDTFKTLHGEGVWFEMTTLVVPGYVDKPEMIKQMCGWILKELGPDYPLHLLRFFPQYKLTRLPATPISTLENLRTLALKEGIHYVYLGNVPGHEGTQTTCHNCRKVVIDRNGYTIGELHMKDGRCEFCGTPIPGRWS
ncbi:MAG TPA: AmmeMemoRadiSam system radical SAM enzyme [Deltaproteobacteria bacterium]|nr:AmmeMemoRadiSam system radical SAM enzyme [Deltaproteobacteria bacterium]HIJ36940.1 AmmeMemoRadiSam system radical SAM enzyme [Deltaproteobacteria bacterium]HIJ41494.1 AmmeMemoRadiSam system radical SAM enzyme [Deltaproteobacteria bacterium]